MWGVGRGLGEHEICVTAMQLNALVADVFFHLFYSEKVVATWFFHLFYSEKVVATWDLIPIQYLKFALYK